MIRVKRSTTTRDPVDHECEPMIPQFPLLRLIRRYQVLMGLPKLIPLWRLGSVVEILGNIAEPRIPAIHAVIDLIILHQRITNQAIHLITCVRLISQVAEGLKGDCFEIVILEPFIFWFLLYHLIPQVVC